MTWVRPILRQWRGWLFRLAWVAVLLGAGVTVYLTNYYLTLRFTESTRNRAEQRLLLNQGNIISELQRNSVVPLLLSRDPVLIAALNTSDFKSSSQRLIEFRDEIGAKSILMLDTDGRAVAATDRPLLGSQHSSAAYFVDAQRASDTVFTVHTLETGAMEFAYSRLIRHDGRGVGVIVVEVDLGKFETQWRGLFEAVLVTDSTGQVILSTEPRWRGHTVADALAQESAPSAIRSAADWPISDPDAYLFGEAVMRSDARIPFRGWRLTSFTAYSSVRERVNGVLALEIMGFALLLAGSFWFLSRKARSERQAAQEESAKLRQLNIRLQREIAEREKAERNLEVAEQTLAQSSKLAALGEMSASVSHELNQPLAAMRTYLAGARLLLERKRPIEALSSFQRIDDLIGRMGAITRQLKSYARKGEEAFEPFDLRDAISAALTMMEPQLRGRHVQISRSVPVGPVMVAADKLRVEQVLVNLFRNALDATREVEEPALELILSAGDQAVLSLRDNGHGIDDLDNLFEPFYTTKAPGDGVGLGLAISSGIINELGGRLTARNGRSGGAVFEIRLPMMHPQRATAAE